MMDSDGFSTVKFPPPSGGFVYIFYLLAGDNEIPFYVGEADCFQTRMIDYCRKQFSCQNEFNVGEATEYLNSKQNCQVVVKYKASKDRHQEEQDIIGELRTQGYRLLNRELGYDYHAASKQERDVSILQQRARVERFCDLLLAPLFIQSNDLSIQANDLSPSSTPFFTRKSEARLSHRHYNTLVPISST
jgi:hypothetical protein